MCVISKTHAGSICNRKLTVLKSALFWDFTQRRVVTPYRRFGIAYRSHIQESSSSRRNFKAAQGYNFLSTFRDNILVKSSRRAQISLTSQRNPEITHMAMLKVSLLASIDHFQFQFFVFYNRSQSH